MLQARAAFGVLARLVYTAVPNDRRVVDGVDSRQMWQTHLQSRETHRLVPKGEDYRHVGFASALLLAGKTA